MKYGKWTILEESKKIKGRIHLLCECDCGRIKFVKKDTLLSGGSKGCASCHFKTHGMKKTPEYRAWSSMKKRCNNKNATAYKYYGGRGISICERWNSFENFFVDMGERPAPNLTLERIDNDKGYSLSNCRWATWKEQNWNSRNVRLVETDGFIAPLVFWAKVSGIHENTIHHRLRLGWEPKRAVFQALRPRKSLE